jgi:hypothetical protein
MSETERTDQSAESTTEVTIEDASETSGALVEPPTAPPAAPAIDPAQVLAGVSAQTLADAEAALRALATEHATAAVPALALVAHEGSLALAGKAMAILADLRLQEAADALATLGVNRADPARAKDARRLLHKLSLAGVKPGIVAAAPRPEPPPDKVYACLASPIDGEGMRSITVCRQNQFDVLGLAVFLLNEDMGVMEAFGAVPCSMTTWKRYLADAEEREQKLFPVELAFCQQQLETAAARTARSKTPLPEHYYMYLRLAMGESDLRRRPAELDADAVQANPDWLAKSADLFAKPEFKTWLLPLDDMRPHALKMISEVRRQQQAEKQQQDLPVMDLAQLQRQGAVVSIAMNALFDGARRAVYQARLEYTADILWRADRQEEAQWAMAASLALSPESTLPVDQHPFLREVVQRSMLLTVQAEHTGPSPDAKPSAGGASGAEKKAEAEEYVDSEGLIRRKSGLIIPR